METSQAIPNYPIRTSQRTEPFYVRRLPRWKRAMDIVGAFVGLILFSPVFAAIATYIRIVSPGPVIFKQTRIGRGGRHFEFIKFRTMIHEADTESHRKYLCELIHDTTCDAAGKPMIKLENDSRIVPLGEILRKSYLDELPQLVNVLKGQMSLVGPRPPIPYEVQEYSKWHTGRFDCLPGMTGLWQVSGKNNLTFQEMVRLDIQYARKMSLLLDLKILLKTPFAIMKEVFQFLKKGQTKD
jgi:lipopolysaccharide/colanic/teichoic acid biosynthesis glycosyltransferase